MVIGRVPAGEVLAQLQQGLRRRPVESRALFHGGQLYTKSSDKLPQLDLSTTAGRSRPPRFAIAGRGCGWLPQVRVHDLKHTFGRRLRAAGVSFEDRQDLLGHRSGRITTHYSAAELQSLLDAANRVCDEGSRKTPALVVMKRKAPAAIAASA